MADITVMKLYPEWQNRFNGDIQEKILFLRSQLKDEGMHVLLWNSSLSVKEVSLLFDNFLYLKFEHDIISFFNCEFVLLQEEIPYLDFLFTYLQILPRCLQLCF